MVLNIPQSLSPLHALNFLGNVENCSVDREFYYDFQQLQHCPPFGMLILAHTIRSNMRKYYHSRHSPMNFEYNQGSNYASNLGLFQIIGWDIGNLKKFTDHNERQIPITKISIKDIQEKYLEKTIIFGEMVDFYARELALILTQDESPSATDTLQYCIREMMRNTFEHSGAKEVWICGQYWPKRGRADIAILDEGCGISKSLMQNSRFHFSSDAEANKLALQPGISRTLGLKHDPWDVWENSGYGLFMASSLCSIGGEFWLCSGDNATLINSDIQKQYEINLAGTAIGMSIRTDNIPNIDQSLKELSERGAEIARENGTGILTASKVSTIASIVKSIK